jgi:tRNA pseudouridine55 synthase
LQKKIKPQIDFESLKILKKNQLPEQVDFEEGRIILVNKPLLWTSFDVVNKIKYAIKYNHHLKKIKIGHAGTLDPMAEGLLIICTGKYTKLLESLSSDNKSYKATIKLGVTTASYDRESEEENQMDISSLTDEEISKCITGFQGESDQIPPIFSAIKIKGQKSYSLARRGKSVEMQSRPVNIFSIGNITIDRPNVTFDCNVSKGTYIRSLAHDIGEQLGKGAYLVGLNRETIGRFSNEDAIELDTIIDYIKSFNTEIINNN